MRAWQGLLHAYHQVIRTLDGELRSEHDVSLATYDVLLRLARGPTEGLRMTDLAKRVMLSPSGVTRTVDGLVAKGLVERQTEPGDGRVARASLTKDGRKFLRKAAGTHLRGIREHFTGQLSDPQLRNVASALERIAGPHHPH